MSHASDKPSSQGAIQKRAIDLFSYLLELARLRSAIVRDVANYEATFWFSDVPPCPKWKSIAATNNPDDDEWLTITRIKEPACPPVPEICAPWLPPECMPTSDAEPTLRQTILSPRSPDQQSTQPDSYLSLTDYPEVIEAYAAWISKQWQPWAELHREWRTFQSVYDKLYTMYELLPIVKTKKRLE
jgi:hypothetical protein